MYNYFQILFDALKKLRMHSIYYCRLALTLAAITIVHYLMFYLYKNNLLKSYQYIIAVLMLILFCFSMYYLTRLLIHCYKIMKKKTFDVTNINRHVWLYDCVYIYWFLIAPIVKRILNI